MESSAEGPAREMTPWELLVSRFHSFLVRLRRKFPYIVWYDQELDVRVQFLAKRLSAESFDDAFSQLWSGDLHEAMVKLREAGVTFDTGMGCGGRDWEWDWSLRGPISVRFRSRAQHPERRGWDGALREIAP